MTETSLQQMLQRRVLPAKPLRLSILRQVAAELDEASQRNATHGNLTPGSITVFEDQNGEKVSVSVNGFGTKFVLKQDEANNNSSLPEGVHYISPEQVLGLDVSPQSDEFSLAVIAYELLCGKKPFDALVLSGLFYKICSEPPEPADRVDPDVSRGAGDVLNRALAKHREQRYPNCRQFIETLALALESSPGWKETAPEPVPPPVPAFAAAPVSTMAAATAPAKAPETPPVWTPPEPAFASPPPLSGGAPVRSIFELPPPKRRGRRAKNAEGEEAVEDEPRSKKAAVIAALCLFAAGAAAYFFYKMPASNLPAQVLDTKAGPASAPPAEQSAPAPSTSTESAPSTTAPAPITPPASTTARKTPDLPSNPVRVPPANPRAAGMVANVELLTQPPGATVTVDNKPSSSCKAPCSVTLSNGRHTLTTQLAGYTFSQRIFNVPESSSVFVALNRLTGTLVVTSTPAPAAILIDGTDFGHTPATLHIAPGQHRLSLINGAQRHDETVNVEADGIQATGYTFAR